MFSAESTALLKKGFSILLESYDLSKDTTSRAWDFAVNISHLREAGLRDSHFRWMVIKGYVEHAEEITCPGRDGRAFRKTGTGSFSNSTCFVLTEAGCEFAKHLQKDAEPPLNTESQIDFADKTIDAGTTLDSKSERSAGNMGTQGKPSGRRFLVALSFPGEKRTFVEQVATCLCNDFARDRIFYDKFYEEELARPNLDIYLQNIYRKESDLVVPFFCAEYEKKRWCGVEWRAIRSSIMERREDDALMAMRFDDTEIEGFLPTDGYLDVGEKSPKEISSLIVQRVNRRSGMERPQDQKTSITHRSHTATANEENLDPEEKELLRAIQENNGSILVVKPSNSPTLILIAGKTRFETSVYSDAFRGLKELRYLVHESGDMYVLSREGRRVARLLSGIQETTTDIIPEQHLSKEAHGLLFEAVEDRDGIILSVRTRGGLSIETNNKNMVAAQDARCQAVWQGALDELLENGLIAHAGDKGEVFRVTRRGYEVADLLRGSAQ
jgi:hypothetical protein